ncbi:hypothetical protein NKZ05_11555 [Stutzerimonas stutzeri]|uniref:hypothetical protein n=1 Tax=Stutzerimonas stutzeri TaxID=316 RepID=UPI00387DC53E
MADIELSVEGSYRRVAYTVTLIGSTFGREQWTFNVDIRPLQGWVTGDTFISPGFYNTDAQAQEAAVELVKLYIDRQWSLRAH